MTEDKNQPQRKQIRLKNFEYNTVGAYFVTVCTEGRKCILSEVVREEDIDKQINLTSADGQISVGAAIGSPSIDQDNLTSANGRYYATVGARIARPSIDQDNHISADGQPFVGARIARPSIDQDNLTSANGRPFVGARIARPSIDQDNHTSADGQISVGARIARPCATNLTEIGIIVDNAIQNIPDIYPSVVVEEYVIMPNHIHIILRIRADKYGRPMAAPTISRVINQLKGYVSKQVGYPIWQKLFYDHVIRNKKDYDRCVKYIYENPTGWFYDELNPESREINQR